MNRHGREADSLYLLLDGVSAHSPATSLRAFAIAMVIERRPHRGSATVRPKRG